MMCRLDSESFTLVGTAIGIIYGCGLKKLINPWKEVRSYYGVGQPHRWLKLKVKVLTEKLY
jgi:hypothetical protein